MPYISQSTLDKIRDTTLSEALKGFVTIKKAGSVWKGVSPFNEEDKTPSFMVSDTKGIWKCYSTGKGGKDLISFIMAKESLDFMPAAIRAAKELKIPIQYEEETKEAKEKREHSEVLKSIVNKANNSYQKNWKRLPDDHWAKKYMLETRGFTPEILDQFDIGFAYNDSRLAPIIKSEGLLADALELGLIKQDEQNETRHYDFFRDRVIFPIYDHRTDCVGFSGRINPEHADDKKKQKYLNSSESKIFNKSKILFGYNQAKTQIRFFGYALLVEGPTDVIRMHQVGFDNAVATQGTALTAEHIKELKKVTDKVVIFRDNDNAGQKAVLRDMELLLKNNMIVEVVVPENEKDDPDSIGQQYGKDTIGYVSALMEDAILYQVKKKYNDLMSDTLAENEKINEELIALGKKPKNKKVVMPAANKKAFVDFICETVEQVSDSIVKNQYIKDIVNRYEELSAKEINDTIKSIEDSKRSKKASWWDEYQYELPGDVTCKLEDVLDDIKEYGMFQSDNKIFVKIDGVKSSWFKEISNFSIEIVQHMQDEKFPMKLIRVCNVHKIEKIFDVISDRINTLQSFKNVVTSHGNFFFSGSAADHESLLKYLFDKMGNGRKIDILGWQPEGFWVWNNKVIIPGNREEEINKEGLVKFNNESYYIPSANKNYEKNMFAFGPQKKFRSISSDITAANYFSQVYKVHREHAITGILFGIASLYQDIIVNSTGFFPILFYFGPASTGKDNLGEAIQSLLGVPQTAIQLEGGASTIKAQIREFSQFNNGISQLSEYKRGNPQLDGVLKGLWDRRGYKRGSLESRVATDEIPILSSTILTGNDFPDAEALITRCLWEEMKVQEFDDKAKNDYNKLKDIIKKGVSGISDFFINKRLYFEDLFLESYRANVKLLNDLDDFKDTTSRIISNLAVILSVYNLFEKENFFPFRQSEVIKHFASMVENQKKKLATASPFIKFWDCFIMCMRGNVTDQLRVNQDLRIDGSILSFNYKIAFMKIQRMWLAQYQESAPRNIKEILIEDSSFVDKDVKMRVDKDSNPTSVIQFDLGKLGELKENIMHQVNVQLNQGTLFAQDKKEDSANPNAFTESEKSDDDDDGLVF
ncbi:DNA primase [Epilithonimonas hominis]|uniref:DNA primase n=1 Tax=Epilithonimonas hominis TaxID=420404 RepID=UPI0028966EA3|nr:DNA primase [Epilithonimonas hominis]